jgi:hypothetical protein
VLHTRIAKDAIDGKATREQYNRAKDERAAVFAWLEANDYEAPAPFESCSISTLRGPWPWTPR